MPDDDARAGRFASQPCSFRAFVPALLPPSPPLDLGAGLLAALSLADIGIGRLD